MKVNITKLLTIISYISFCIFFIIGIQTNKIIYCLLCVISLLSGYILLVIYLNETLDDEWEDFIKHEQEQEEKLKKEGEYK